MDKKLTFEVTVDKWGMLDEFIESTNKILTPIFGLIGTIVGIIAGILGWIYGRKKETESKNVSTNKE